MKLPESNHVVWIIAVIGLLIVSDTATSVLLYKNGYDIMKDPVKTGVIVTVLVPLLVAKWKGNNGS